MFNNYFFFHTGIVDMQLQRAQRLRGTTMKAPNQRFNARLSATSCLQVTINYRIMLRINL